MKLGWIEIHSIVLMGDASVHFMTDSTDLSLHRALHSRNGHEVVQDF